MMQAQTHITELLKLGRLLKSAEIIPPRNGADFSKIKEQISSLKEVPVDFISVTKGAGGSLRGGTLPIAQIIKDQFGICSLAHFTCRDYTVNEVENSLMDHHYFGVHNILALRGDPPDGQPDLFLNNAKPHSQRHAFAWQLVNQIRKLNQGEYIVRPGFDKTTESGLRSGEKTDFCVGVAAHPEEKPFEKAIEYLKVKVDNGAKFAITQMLFFPEVYSRFLDACAKQNINIPIFPGIRILTQASAGKMMVERFGVSAPDKLLLALENAKDKESAKTIGFDFTYDLCQKLIKAGAPGIHIFVMFDAVLGAKLLKAL
ncbi:MAG: methylenetetrahydrofolate reductase [Bacteriovoracia bacterium]